jgi:hypothetical protein
MDIRLFRGETQDKSTQTRQISVDSTDFPEQFSGTTGTNAVTGVDPLQREGQPDSPPQKAASTPAAVGDHQNGIQVGLASKVRGAGFHKNSPFRLVFLFFTPGVFGKNSGYLK